MSVKYTNLEKKIQGQDETYQAQRKALTNKYEQYGKIHRDLKSLEKVREKQLRCRHRDLILSELPALTPNQVNAIKNILTD